MRILILIDYLPDQNSPGGGLQNYVTRIAEALTSLGEEVFVITRTKTDSRDFSFNVKTVNISYKEKKLLQFLQSITFHRIDYSLVQLQDAWAARRECRKIHGIDIIQSPNYKFPGLFAQKRGSKLVVRASSYRSAWTEEKKPSTDTRFTTWLEQRLFKRADLVFAPSKHLAEMLETALGRAVDVIPTPIPEPAVSEDPSWYKAHLSGKKFMLYFGTMLERKGLFVLAEAMKQVWQEFPDALLVLAGPDLVVDGRSNLEHFMEIIGEDKDRVIYTNNLQQNRLVPVIRQSHFVVQPSIEDNSPNSMLEAMALGKAVLGTIGSSLNEFYPPACADLLVPRGDAGALAEKILWLWNLPLEQLNKYGEESKRYVEENHSPAVAAHALLNYYRRILAQS